MERNPRQEPRDPFDTVDLDRAISSEGQTTADAIVAAMSVEPAVQQPPLATRCLECGRRLRAERSVARRRGPTCFRWRARREQAEAKHGHDHQDGDR